MKNHILIFETKSKSCPFINWLELLDLKTRVRVRNRIIRVEYGNFGDYRNVGDGVFELRLFFGPGYRIYFGKDGSTTIILLSGGDKSSQDKDIKQAKLYWKQYKDNVSCVTSKTII